MKIAKIRDLQKGNLITSKFWPEDIYKVTDITNETVTIETVKTVAENCIHAQWTYNNRAFDLNVFYIADK